MPVGAQLGNKLIDWCKKKQRDVTSICWKIEDFINLLANERCCQALSQLQLKLNWASLIASYLPHGHPPSLVSKLLETFTKAIKQSFLRLNWKTTPIFQQVEDGPTFLSLKDHFNYSVIGGQPLFLHQWKTMPSFI